MQARLVRYLSIGGILAGVTFAFYHLAARPASQPPGAASAATLPVRAVAVRLQLGLLDEKPADWSGQFRLPAARVLAIEGVERSGATGWRAKSTVVPKNLRQQEPPVRPAVLLATLDVDATQLVEVETVQGRFAFRPNELEWAKPRAFLKGAVTVERVPVSVPISAAQTHDDFPALARALDGTVWCVYVSYAPGDPVDEEAARNGKFDSLLARNNGDQIHLARYQAGQWNYVAAVTGEKRDVWKPSVVVTAKGTLWIVWAENVNGNWDIYARSFEPARNDFGPTLRVSSASGPDTNAVAATDGAMGAWVAWQGWNGKDFDIWLARVEPGEVGQPIRVSTSPANDWYPAIATGIDGTVWVAWDTYHKGDYDVYVRAFRNGVGGDAIPVATSPRYEARPSIGTDSQGRLWVAYEDADVNWGKDYGQRWPWKQGVPFYRERFIKLRQLTAGRLVEPVVSMTALLHDTPYDDTFKVSEYAQRTSIPVLAVDSLGRPWIFYRRHPLAAGRGEIWASYARYYQGGRWSEEIELPGSTGRLDVKPAIAVDSRGLFVVYSTDDRRQNIRDSKVSHLRLAWIPTFGTAEEPVMRVVSPEIFIGSRPEPVHPNEAQDVERLRSYRIRLGTKELRYLRGEFHRHTEFSAHRDWDGPLEEVWRYGWDVANLDWIGPGDHDYGYGLDYPWWLTQKQSDMYHVPGRFLIMFTYERSTPYPSGHRNVMFARRGIRPVPRLQGDANVFGTAEKGAPDVKNLYAYLRYFGGICASHTTASDMGTDWRDHDPELEPVVEIFQGHRLNYEEPNAPMAPRGPEDTIQGFRPQGFVWNALRKGLRLGFQASSDHLSTHISYAIVLAEEATREGIIQAFKQRHCYAAQDNILLDVRCGQHLMGETFVIREWPRLDIRVVGTAPVASLRIIRQLEGQMPTYVASFEPNQQEVQLSWSDRNLEPGTRVMYYVRVEQHDRKLAWSSPLWIEYRP